MEGSASGLPHLKKNLKVGRRKHSRAEKPSSPLAQADNSHLPTAVFGKSLVKAAELSDPEGLCPSVLRDCISYLNDHIAEEGLYRVPGGFG